MMNKKTIALSMAAMTVATSVAPVFADAKVEKYDVNVKDAGKVVAKVRELLATKYDDKTAGKVYTITTNYELDGAGKLVKKENNEITNATDLANILNAVAGEVVTIKVRDNGHAVVDGKIVGSATKHYDNVIDLKAAYEAVKNQADAKEVGSDEAKAALAEKLDAPVAIINKFDNKKGETKLDMVFDVVLNDRNTIEDVKSEISGLENVTVEEMSFVKDATETKVARITKTLELKNGSELLKDNDDIKIVVNKVPTIVADAIAALTLNNLEKVSGFEVLGAQRIEGKDSAIVNVTGAELTSIEANKLFDGLMLTKEGKELANANGSTVEIDGKKYTITTDVSDITEVIKGKEYKMTVSFKKALVGARDLAPGAYKELTITAGSKEELVSLKAVLADTNKAVKDLVGANRFETAVSVSNELFTDAAIKANHAASADAIVLVQKDAIVDGLAATPLAHMAKAPVLFANTDSVPANVIAEMKRALDIKGMTVGQLEEKTVYIVGGTSRISKSVEDQIKRELGVSIKRVAGDTRTETSVKIAEEMKKVAAKKSIDMSKDVFVVGRDGEADAMSVSGYAASKNAPIIVSERNELTKVASDFLEKEAKTADIIGGNTVVKSEIKDELAGILEAKNVERVEGARRSETNANVINKYYKAGVTGVIVAKDGKAKVSDLSDSLVAGPLAAKNNTPVVLTTTGLDANQKEVLELRAAGANKLTQVGGGVSRTVVETIAKMFGLIK